MEDIVLVTGCHRTRSWTNTTFNEVQTNTQLSLGVEVGALGASVNWQVSNRHIQGAVLGHGPSGEVCHASCKGQRILKSCTLRAYLRTSAYLSKDSVSSVILA